MPDALACSVQSPETSALALSASSSLPANYTNSESDMPARHARRCVTLTLNECVRGLGPARRTLALVRRPIAMHDEPQRTLADQAWHHATRRDARTR